MLKITRHFGERFVIGDNVIVEIISMRGSRVGLLIKAPKEVPIYREELLTPEQVAAVEARAKEGHHPCTH